MDQLFLQEIGLHIKNERKKRNIKKSTLARALGVSDSTIDSIERGNRGTSLENYKAIADYFGITVDELIHDKEHMPEMKEGVEETSKQKLVRLCRQLTEKQAAFVLEFVSNFIEYAKE